MKTDRLLISSVKKDALLFLHMYFEMSSVLSSSLQIILLSANRTKCKKTSKFIVCIFTFSSIFLSFLIFSLMFFFLPCHSFFFFPASSPLSSLILSNISTNQIMILYLRPKKIDIYKMNCLIFSFCHLFLLLDDKSDFQYS